MNRQAGQPVQLYLWCEAGGMVPQLARVADPYDVPVLSGGGFDSITMKHELAVEFARYEQFAHDAKGITARAGGGRIAWFQDSGGNTFAIEADV